MVVPDHKGKKDSIRMKSFVEKLHLTLPQFMSAAYFWSNDVEMTGLSERVVIGWYNFCREVCLVWLTKNTRPIGGVEHTVYIDETVMSRTK